MLFLYLSNTYNSLLLRNLFQEIWSYFIVCSTSFDKGYGHTMHQLRRLEMQPYIVVLKFYHLTGSANQTAWYVNWFIIVIEIIPFYWLYYIVNQNNLVVLLDKSFW